MQAFVEYYREHIYFLFILAALLVLTIWVVSKALKSSSARRKANEEVMKKLEEDTALRREFENLTPEKAQEAPPEKLFKGVALGLCREIEKSTDMLAVFNSFNEKQKQIYALYFVFEDGAEKLSKFFKINGKPLTDYAKSAVDSIYGGEIADVFGKEYLAYDEDDETTSLIPADIEKNDEQFISLINGIDIFTSPAQYIIENIKDFTNE
ncbi:MAG: hypothetical protein IKH13_08895 [Clostridia bacterium]|nr:hypothetical protein [Clostridia bacterium]